MKRRVHSSYSRYDYMDMIDDIIRQTGNREEVEEILDRHNASEDDSNPEEGYYASMSEDDLKSAYQEILKSIELDPESDPESYYYSLSSRNDTTEYEQGWLDGYEACLNKRW